MNKYFIKAFIEDSFMGLNGTYEVIEHFSREEEDLTTLIYTIIKACKSIEEWTIEVRLNGLKSPFKYGLSQRDINKLSFDEQLNLLQYYCNVYLILYHISKSTLDRLDKEYKERLKFPLEVKGGDEFVKYIAEANRRCLDKYNRSLL